MSTARDDWGCGDVFQSDVHLPIYENAVAVKDKLVPRRSEAPLVIELQTEGGPGHATALAVEDPGRPP